MVSTVGCANWPPVGPVARGRKRVWLRDHATLWSTFGREWYNAFLPISHQMARNLTLFILWQHQQDDRERARERGCQGRFFGDVIWGKTHFTPKHATTWGLLLQCLSNLRHQRAVIILTEPTSTELQTCQKSQWIGCVIPCCNLPCGITQPILRLC